MNERTLTINLRPDWQSALRAAAKVSSQPAYQGEDLNFESPAQFFGQLTERRRDLVRTAEGKAPMAISQLQFKL